jgi:hypothetical protein
MKHSVFFFHPIVRRVASFDNVRAALATAPARPR